MDAITRVALSKYPASRHRELELLFYATRKKHARPTDQITDFWRLADAMPPKEQA